MMEPSKYQINAALLSDTNRGVCKTYQPACSSPLHIHMVLPMISSILATLQFILVVYGQFILQIQEDLRNSLM